MEGDVTVTCSWSMCNVNGCPTFTRGIPIFELSMTRPTGVRTKTKLDLSLDTVPERRKYAVRNVIREGYLALYWSAPTASSPSASPS